MPKKERVPIPDVVAAEVLFRADRTCCVCRVRSKPVQIHHIDDDPSNNDPSNLSVLCFDCHRETQIRGGFDRKLDADQVRLYRDDWNRIIDDIRATSLTSSPTEKDESSEVQLEIATTIAEIYREEGDWTDLAIHYYQIGNNELRDKYIDKALADPEISPYYVLFLRARLQGRPDLVPEEVADAALKNMPPGPDRARVLRDLKRTREAVLAYMEVAKRALRADNPFSAAFYLSELADEGLVQALYKEALAEATAEDDLWWQVRPLQELGWLDELRELLIRNSGRIRSEGNPRLLRELAWAEDDPRTYVEASKELANERVSLRPQRLQQTRELTAAEPEANANQAE